MGRGEKLVCADLKVPKSAVRLPVGPPSIKVSTKLPSGSGSSKGTWGVTGEQRTNLHHRVSGARSLEHQLSTSQLSPDDD
jgi:hypothetical protein